MCGRFSLQVTAEQLASEFNVVPMGFREERRYNIAPGQWVIVVRPEHNQRTASLARWGLVPSWSRDPEGGPKPINARAEGIADKPMFRSALRHGRCLIPASGFYEWKQVGKTKVPHYIRPKEGGIWVFAGLWSSWSGPGGELNTFTIITTTPNRTMEPIHSRMPVILSDEDRERWLSPDLNIPTDLLVPCPDEWMEVIQVGPAVGNPRNDGPGLIEEIEGTPQLLD